LNVSLTVTHPDMILKLSAVGAQDIIADLLELGNRDILAAHFLRVILVRERSPHEVPAALFRRAGEEALHDVLHHGKESREFPPQLGVAVPRAHSVDDHRRCGREALVQGADEEDVED